MREKNGVVMKPKPLVNFSRSSILVAEYSYQSYQKQGHIASSIT
jgi:hypothetical protein